MRVLRLTIGYHVGRSFFLVHRLAVGLQADGAAVVWKQEGSYREPCVMYQCNNEHSEPGMACRDSVRVSRIYLLDTTVVNESPKNSQLFGLNIYHSITLGTNNG